MTYIKEDFASLSVQIAHLDVLHYVIGPIQIHANPIHSQRLDESDATRDQFDGIGSVLVRAVNSPSGLVGPVDAFGSIVEVERGHLVHHIGLAHHAHVRAVNVGNDQRTAIGHKHFGLASLYGLAAVRCRFVIAWITQAVVAAWEVGTSLTTCRFHLTLVDVLALLVVGFVCGLEAHWTKAHGAHW